MVGITAVIAFFAGKGRDARAGVDNDGLSLGRGGSEPEIDVVCAVALVEGAHLLLEGSGAAKFVRDGG
jgi:hypothetical protein